MSFTSSHAFVGRDEERARLMDLVANIAGGHTSALAIVGEAGVGKTRLVTEAITSDQCAVLAITGFESDCTTPLAGLYALAAQLDQAIGDDYAAILDQAEGTAARLGVATLEALSAAAFRRPTLLFVDDGQWLDRASARAILFAIRRSVGERIGLVVTLRSGVPSVFNEASLTTLHLDGLAEQEAATLWPGDAAAPLVEQTWMATRGNPMATIELIQRLSREQIRGDAPVGSMELASSPITKSVCARVLSLSDGAQWAMAIVAAAGTDSTAIVHATLADAGVTNSDLDSARAADLLADGGGAPTLAHPLVRPAVVDAVGNERMRAAHRALAAAYGDDVRGAWHWAAGCDGPDESAAVRLYALGSRCESRGALAAAADAFRRSAEMTADRSNLFDRLFDAGRLLAETSRPGAAARVLQSALAIAEFDRSRAQCAGVLGDCLSLYRSSADGIQLQQSTARQIGPAEPDEAATLELRAAMQLLLAGDGQAAIEGADRGAQLAASGAGVVAVMARAVRAVTAAALGHGDAADGHLAGLAPLAVMSAPDHTRDTQVFATAVGYALLARDRPDEALDVLSGALRSARAMGLDNVVSFCGGFASDAAFRKGRFVHAVALARPDFELHQQDEGNATPGQAALTRAYAVLGKFDESQQYGALAVANARRIGLKAIEAWALSGLGLAHLAQGDVDSALGDLRQVADLSAGMPAPSYLWYEHDLAEALLRAGHRRDAAALAASLRRRACDSMTPFGIAVADRVEAQLYDDESQLDRALRRFEEMGAAFEVARTVLVAAEHFGRPDAAGQAAVQFAACAAAPWVERAVMLDTPQRPLPAASLSELSPAELRVASAVGEGLTNRQAAAELFLSAKTVDAHLQSIYRKLQINRRAELVRLMSGSLQDAATACSPR
jgi:DNA-binding CsgD family transcriptional regulator